MFIQVDQVADYVARAHKLGARTIIPPQALPGGDVLAIMQDTQGLAFGLMSPVGGGAKPILPPARQSQSRAGFLARSEAEPR